MINRHSIESLCGLPEKNWWQPRGPRNLDVSFDDAFARKTMARDEAHAALEARAGKAVRDIAKWRVRSYALRPRELDEICCGLSVLLPARLCIMLKAITNIKHHYIGFGDEIPEINLKAAMWYARHSRAIASRNARRSAA